jgi:two-component system phosphate regulon response regulator PhoB
LKADPKTAHLPLLGLLRARHEQNYIRLLKAGIDEVFVRPVSPERILAYLRSLAGSWAAGGDFASIPQAASSLR